MLFENINNFKFILTQNDNARQNNILIFLAKYTILKSLKKALDSNSFLTEI